MELYLQVGWGMMEHCRALCREWGGVTSVLSPRDLNPSQLMRLSADLRGLGGDVLLDPQFYLPRADHRRLTSHGYWPRDYDTAGFADGGLHLMVGELAQLNLHLGTSSLIVPGKRAEQVDGSWLDTQQRFAEAAREITNQRLIATVCLSGEAVRSTDQISLVMEQAEDLQVSGFYLVTERPRLAYLMDDPLWLANVLDLAAGLRRLGAEVIVGYSNQQQIVLACAGVNAIASGTWMNLRSFPPDKFHADYQGEVKRRAVWYYCPQALSEYRLAYLDLAFARLGLERELLPDPPTPYAEPLFAAGGLPSASGWGEREAFRHYLTALRTQAQLSTRDSFDETVADHRALLGRAEQLLAMLRERGIRGEGRDFWHAVVANGDALTVLEATHGPVLRRVWGDLA